MNADRAAFEGMIAPMACYVGIDYGTRRIGLAVGHDDTGIASPLGTVAATGDVGGDVAAVRAAAAGYAVDGFVVGLPLNMDDSEGPQAKLSRRFGAALAAATGRPVHYADERLSTFEAGELMQPAGLTRRKKKAVRDAVAAQVILQGFLVSLRGDAGAAEKVDS